MARRKRKGLIDQNTAVGLLIVVIGIWLVGRIARSVMAGSGTVIGLLILTLVVAAAFPITLIVNRSRARQALMQMVRTTTESQMEPLLRRRAQLVRLDPYGKPQAEKWTKEINYFIEQHITPALSKNEQLALRRNYVEVLQVICTRVEAAQGVQPAFPTFSDSMTPSEFETFCAEQLRLGGWNARVTLQSRDQGVDVIGEKNGCRIVLQCKLYGRPVGNKAVQEVAAGRIYERAQFGIVVSNNRYTDAAEQLAATNGILLLHYRDLRNLEECLSTHLTMSERAHPLEVDPVR
jgi:restriction system protein